jgi:hypothetical protein
MIRKHRSSHVAPLFYKPLTTNRLKADRQGPHFEEFSKTAKNSDIRQNFWERFRRRGRKSHQALIPLPARLSILREFLSGVATATF